MCTFLFVLAPFWAPAGLEAAEAEDLAQYQRAQLSAGAKTLPVLARLAYRDALADLHEGEFEAAEKQLLQALKYDPQYVDPYFTLARVKLRQYDPELAVYLAQGFTALGRSFTTQSLFVLNAVVAIPYVLILVSLIVCLALAIKYLPFAVHRFKEFLQERFRAAFPGLSAYLILLLPLVLVPGAVTALAYLTVVCWLFMYRRERFLMIVLLVPFIVLGFFGSYLRPLTPLADPKSLTSLIVEANEAPGDSRLIRELERTPAEGLEAEKNNALGILHQRSGRYTTAADYFFRAISVKPDEPRGYINLGNVYFLQGSYDKALEGYRKAEAIEPRDAVCQHGLAQAFIKTLLMKEASKSLQLAATLGLDKVKSSYAEEAVNDTAVFPKTFSNAELWRIAFIEGSSSNKDVLNELMLPLTRFPRKATAWILLGALAIGFLLSRVVDPSKLTFQCSNCGRLTCESCCNTDREMHLCQECAQTVEGVTSERVTEALLRQKRQNVVVNRRKSSRFITILLPGMRDISYGRISRGFYLAALFSVGIIQLFARGFLVKDSMLFVIDTPLWKIIIPAAAIVWAYGQSFVSKPQYSFRAYSPPRAKRGARETKSEPRGAARVA
jgi:tetratricopeptide (TPR) repeat protein